MKKSIITLLASASFAANATAASIYTADFTDSGTFSDGPLNSQDNWATNSGSGNVVSGTGVTSTGFEDMVNSTSTVASTVTVGATYTSSVTFTYDDNSAGSGNGPHYGAYISNNADPSSNDSIGFILRRTSGDYRLTMTTNWGNTYGDFGFNQSSTFASTLIGIDHVTGPDTSSDVLTISIALTAGADTSSWTAVGTLYNETTGTEVKTWDGNSTGFTFNAAAGSTLYGGFGGGQGDGNQNIANRTASSYSFESTIVPEPASTTLLGLGLLGLLGRRRRA